MKADAIRAVTADIHIADEKSRGNTMTILNEIPVSVADTYLIFPILIVAAMIFFVVGMLLLIDNYTRSGFWLVTLSILYFIFFLLFCCETDHYRYEVIIDSSYSATELMNQYKVIEQRGEIWVIEDRR